MKKIIVFALLTALLLSLGVALGESASGGAPTSVEQIRYAFAWSAERDEQSAPLSDKTELHLTLVRKEWESFQLLLKADAPDQAVTVEITPFTNINGDTFSAKVYLVGYEVAEDGGSYPTTLTAADGSPVPLRVGLTQSFLVEVETKQDTVVGDYAATLTMKDAAGNVLLEKEVTAEVYPVYFPMATFVEGSMGKKGKLAALTATEAKSFLGYAGNSYDYFRIAMELFGKEWLDENFNNVVTDLAEHMDDADFFAAMRPKLAKALSGDMSDYRPDPSTTLQFNEDGEFTIMVLADMHYGGLGGRNVYPETPLYYSKLIEDNDVDLIVFLGDNISSEEHRMGKEVEINGGTMAFYIDQFMPIFEKHGVPVTLVFGNHEQNGALSQHKLMQMSLYKRYENFIAQNGPDITGVANHNLTIHSSDGSRIAFNLWFLDSNVNGVEQDQIDWYVQTSNALRAQNGGEPVPSMLFQHIPLWIDVDAAVTDEATGVTTTGNAQFDAMLRQGDMVATVYGHLHDSDLIADYLGIDRVDTLCDGIGVRIIRLNEDDLWNYETWNFGPEELGFTTV